MGVPSVVLLRSPLDESVSMLIPSGAPSVSTWVPSRFNVRAVAADGRLLLWNSYTGAMSVFEPERKPAVLGLLARRGVRSPPTGVVGYLVERGFLVEEGTDEIRRLQYAAGQDHYATDALELILLASEDCNFRCSYCYERFAHGTMSPTVRASVKRLIEQRLDGLRSLRVSWFGGEPLYGFAAIEDLAPYFAAVAREHSLHYASHMTTNGYLLTPEVVRRLLAWQVTDFQVTLDGPAEVHDRYRPARDGRGTFATILSNLEAMRRLSDDFSVAVRINFDQRNYPSLGLLFEKLKESLGGDPRFALNFHAIGRWGGPNDEGLAVCGTSEAGRAKAELREAARRRGLAVGGMLKEVRGVGAQVCYAARPHSFIIGADGKIMKCTVALDHDERNVVGRLREDGDLELDDDKMALWTEPVFTRAEQCRKCVLAPTCQGIHCPKLRIEKERLPCPDVRLSLKSEMLATLRLCETGARRVAVRQPSA